MSPKKFVLVHGAWHDKNCWHKTISQLQQMGHSAVAVQLEGLGQDRQPLPSVHLQHHVDTVKAVCQEISHQQQDLILMGHCYGGVVISQVAELIPECLEQCVYLSGILLEDGECVMDIYERSEGSLIAQAMQIVEPECAINLPPEVLIPGFFGGILNEHLTPGLEKDVQELLRHIKPQPLHTFLERVSLGENYQGVPKLFVECSEDRAIPIDMQRWMHRRDASVYRTVTIRTDHSPYVTNPMEVLKVLAKVAKLPPRVALNL